jgi:iron complex transport system ATP-binding protein
MLQATDIDVTLGRRAVLCGVSMTAAPGQITAIVGPNGSGKTTLLRALTGELSCAGRITLDGALIADLGPARLAQRRAVMPQTMRLAFPFTLRDVVAMGLAAGNAAGRPDVAEGALCAVDLKTRAAARFNELSGGEQARGHLARALAQVWDPFANGTSQWLFLDEPVASLDIGHQLLVMDLAADFARRGGGVVVVMHDLNLTAMFAAHVVLMDSGRVMASGTPAEVLTDASLTLAYRTPLRVGRVPAAGCVFLLPQTAAAR